MRRIARSLALTTLAIALSCLSARPAVAQITFTEVGAAVGIDYHRTATPGRLAALEALRQLPVLTEGDAASVPLKAHGAPGVALLDVEADGDLDLYVTNGPGSPNPLYLNRLVEEGRLRFEAVPSGAEATEQDSSGVCAGDIDNDGDPDLYVLGSEEPNRLLENVGDGFVDITARAGVGGGELAASSCSFGDFDGDGLLDLVVGNTYRDWTDQEPIFAVPFARSVHNQLFRNLGANLFEEVGAESGLHDTRGFVPEGFAGSPTITWVVAAVDFDLDGDTDIVTADDQGAFPGAAFGGIDRGLIHLFENDGSGHFTDRTAGSGTDKPGAWMGLAFADLDRDGRLDLFGSNLGAYLPAAFGLPAEPGGFDSRWYLGRGDGTFADPGVGALGATPFGWGAVAADLDNDGDVDLVFHGGLDTGLLVDASNPGVVLDNDGAAHFTWRRDALATDHSRRNVQGVAAGDLDRDGFVDLVSVSNFDTPPEAPLVAFGVGNGSPLDEAAFFVPAFRPIGPGVFTWSGIRYDDGSLTVELNDGRGGGSVTVQPLGTVGLVPEGRVNRDGIGAVIAVTPHGARTSRLPVLGGASYASRSALDQLFGLGEAGGGTVEILWPGGVRNRLYGVRAGERLLFPEIPCSFEAGWGSFRAYRTCVDGALEALRRTGVLDRRASARFRASAVRAFHAARHGR